MTDDKGAAAVVAADDELPDDEAGFEAPERGSAEELLDAGAHATHRRDAPQHRARHGRGGPRPVPGREAGDRARDRERLLLRLPAAAPGDPRRPREDRGAHAGEREGGPPVRPEGAAVRRGEGDRRARGPGLQGRDPRRPQGKAEAAGEPPPVTTFYEHGPFHDLCRGPHVESTGKIGPFKLLAVSGAYWRGDQARASMQRIYGTVWETQEELDQYLWRREEAKKRDHRRLGVQLDLFSFHDVAPGSAFWHPKGWRLYQTLRGAMRELQERRGYEEIYTPPLVHQKLWEQSGHWALYRDNMYLVDVEGQWFSLKPMNCPESSFVYRSRLRSYRDLPLRLSEYGVLHRNELSGVLSGLTRVRHFVTDDAHIYVRPDQIAVGDRGADGRDPGGVRLVRPDADPHVRHAARQGARRPRRVGGDRGDHAGRARPLRPPVPGEGEDGAFYAPKLDIQITDALGREWQTATIQVDRVMLPEQFDLHYVDEHGQQPAAGGDPPRDLRVARAVHRRAHGALRGRVPAVVRPGAGRRDPDRGPARRRGGRAGRASCARPGSGSSRSTTRTTGCRTRSGSPRARRSRTC